MADKLTEQGKGRDPFAPLAAHQSEAQPAAFPPDALEKARVPAASDQIAAEQSADSPRNALDVASPAPSASPRAVALSVAAYLDSVYPTNGAPGLYAREFAATLPSEPQGVVPPQEPSEEMLEAGAGAWFKEQARLGELRAHMGALLLAAYRAMLAAAAKEGR